jgi:ATP-dependent DNA ligase
MTTLFKTNKNGSIQQWSVSTFEDTYTVQFGQVDGAMQTAVTTCTGKHIGKSNETSAIQQAELEAAALVAKKLKSGYSTNPSAPITVSLAMKVKSYQDQLHNVKFPCFSSSKLNGVNGMYKRTNGTLSLYSRGGELYPPIPHLEPLVHQAMDLFNSNELNGELYIHGFALQDITSAVVKPNDNSHLLSFCIFDIADSTEQFYERAMLMHSYSNFDTTIHSTVAVIYNITCLSTAQLEEHFEECTNFGYEGTVVKNYSALYKHNVRSSDMFKYKKAQSAEFLIVGYELDKRKHPVFHLNTHTTPPLTFKAKPVGTHAFVESIDPQSYVGNWATVEYETTSTSGVPLKPIFIGLRDCTPDGKPLV